MHAAGRQIKVASIIPFVGRQQKDGPLAAHSVGGGSSKADNAVLNSVLPSSPGGGHKKCVGGLFIYLFIHLLCFGGLGGVTDFSNRHSAGH